jgi:hypothetical protein
MTKINPNKPCNSARLTEAGAIGVMGVLDGHQYPYLVFQGETWVYRNVSDYYSKPSGKTMLVRAPLPMGIVAL